MNKTQGIEIAEQLRSRGFTLSGWARANRFKLRTVNDFLYAGLGSKRGGETTEADNSQLEIVNATIRAELSSGDKYNSRWRATFGYLVALSWFITFTGLVTALIIVVVKSPEKLGETITAMGNMMASTAMLWGVALSVLGITVTKRSKDKEVAAGVTAAPGIIQSIMFKINR